VMLAGSMAMVFDGRGGVEGSDNYLMFPIWNCISKSFPCLEILSHGC
jgi:hypothetical protein